MKNLILITCSLAFLFSGCTNSSTDLGAQTNRAVEGLQKGQQNRFEIYCFHGTRQCETCVNMKTNTKKTLDTYFAAGLKEGSIVFSIVDVDDAKNEKLAEKYQATGTALMVNKVVNGKDHIEDWSEFAFEKANNAPVFIKELKMKIDKALK